MSDSSNIKPFLLSSLSFIGGVATGMFIASKNNVKKSNWLSTKLRGLSQWDRDNNDIYQLRRHINKGIQQNIPDAYEATEYIPLSEKEMLNG